MKITSLVAFVSFAFLAAPGCGDDSLSREEAGRAFAATSVALGNAQVRAAASVENGQVTATVSCSGGGSATVRGDFDDEESFSLEVSFDGCAEAGVTIDGSMQFAASVSSTGATVTWSGTLSYSGAITGTCTIDVRVRADESGGGVSGTICGQTVSAQSF